MHTLTLAEAADFLKLCSDEIRRRARLGLLPGAKVGRRWVFIEADLASYLRSLYAAPAPEPAFIPKPIDEPWLSTSAATRGGLTSPLHAANALERLLRPATGRKRRNCTIP